MGPVASPSFVPILAAALVALGVSLAVAALLVLTRRWHIRFTGDSHLHLPQKIHREAVPRLGGLAIVAGFCAGLAQLAWAAPDPVALSPRTAVVLLAGLLPIALAGFVEDLTKRVTPYQRLAGIGLGSAVLVHFGGLALARVGVPALDPLLALPGAAALFSLIACVGAANAYNIVDGLNGLLAGVSLITLAAIAWVAATVGDAQVFALAALLGTATLGYLPFNWPRARLFAGDGGAYALGALTAAALLMLVARNPGVSPWFGLAAAALPVWETLYSIWRRARTGLSAMEPDQSHLHQLVRIRLHWLRKHRALRSAGVWGPDWTPPEQPAPPLQVGAPNGAASPVLWGLHAGAAAGGAACFDDTAALAAVFAGFVLVYVALHRRLLRSRAKYQLALAG